MFIKKHTIMNYETTEQRSAVGEADQPGDRVAEEIWIESEGDRRIERGIWDFPASGVSLCEGSGEEQEVFASSRREGKRHSEVASKHKQEGSAVEERWKGEYQRDNGRIVEGLPKTEWGIRKAEGARNSAMNLIDW